MQKDSQVKAIINWYQLNKRKLPFRFSRDPYKIWLSEIMLQQTQVITMCPYYIKWIKKYPNIKSVLSVPYEIILKSWEGLGYYSRCKNFYDALKIVDNVYRGIVPKDYKKFSELPGVGEYTASAVLSIAYNKNYFVIDGNVKRVFSRYLGIKKLTRYNVSRIKNYLNNLIQLTNSGVFNQSIMEIGAILCKKNDPKCYQCPLKLSCVANLNKSPQLYPAIIKKNKLKTEKYVGLILRNKNKFIIIKNKKRLLNGLWNFPIYKIKKNNILKSYISKILGEKLILGNDYNYLKKIGIIKHSYSHYKLKIIYYECFLIRPFPIKSNMKWISKLEIDCFPFSKIFFKGLKLTSI